MEISQGEVRSEADAVKAVDTALTKFGRLDILVNAAAGNFLVPAENLSTKGFKTGDLNVVSFKRRIDFCPWLKRGVPSSA